MTAEATKERILAVAFAEFAAYGFAGARVDRIADAAKCNKNLIYIYFKDKETLFATVMLGAITTIARELPFDSDDLPSYATRAFDFAMEHRDLMRLLTWFSLEQGVGPDATARRASYNAKVAAVTRAQESGLVGRQFAPRFLITSVMALATAWSAASPFGSILDPDATKGTAALRVAVARAVELMAGAQSARTKVRARVRRRPRGRTR